MAFLNKFHKLFGRKLTLRPSNDTDTVLEIIDSTGTQTWAIDANGNQTAESGQVLIAGSASTVPLTVQGTTSQSANLFVVEDSAGTDLIAVSPSSHLTLRSLVDSAQVRINSRNFTQTSGDTIGLQVTPNQAATTTGEVFGAQFKPRVANTFDAATCNGIGIDSELKGSGGGALSSDLRGINMYLGATGSGTIGGDIVGIRARVESNINPTGNIVFLLPVQHEGSQGWDGLVKFDAALGTHSMTTNSDKTGGAKSGTIKVRGADGTLYHIQLYAD